MNFLLISLLDNLQKWVMVSLLFGSFASILIIALLVDRSQKEDRRIHKWLMDYFNKRRKS